MKRLFICLLALVSLLSQEAMAGDVLSVSDSLIRAGGDYTECRNMLEKALADATPGKQKAEIYWRLSMLSFISGETEPTKEGKRAAFGKGISYAEAGISENPSSPDCYMWHSANVGRECQTRSLMEQASKVPVLTKDLQTILDKLGKTEYSAAWQAFAEIYYNHPFKSTDSAINYARKAAMCIPKGELRLSTYSFLAKLLYERNWSREKRKETAAANADRFKNGKFKSIVDCYEYFDGSLTAGYKPQWAPAAFTDMSDRQEAMALVDYALKLYGKSPAHYPTDKKDHAELVKLKNQWK